MTALPAISRSRKAKPVHACACGGCGGVTKGTWTSGHDGHCEGWAHRVRLPEGAKGHIDIADVPDAVRAGVLLRLARVGIKLDAPKTQAERKAERKAAKKLAKEQAANVPAEQTEAA